MDEASRLTRLEEHCANLERHVDEQDKVILDLSKELTRLRREFLILREQVTGSHGQSENLPHERPPHY